MSNEESDRLHEDSELLYRQVNPAWVNSGRPTSQAFRPTPKDKNRLSIDREAKISAKEAYLCYLRRGLKSVGTWGINVSEFAQYGIVCFDDPVVGHGNNQDNAAHAYADFSVFNNSKKKKLSKQLRVIADERGCLYREETSN